MSSITYSLEDEDFTILQGYIHMNKLIDFSNQLIYFTGVNASISGVFVYKGQKIPSGDWKAYVKSTDTSNYSSNPQML